MLNVQNLQHTFNDGTKALKRVNFEVKKGEFVVILGPSGSGKTTLLRSINGLNKPTSGSIILNKNHVNFDDPFVARQHISMIFQDFNLVKNLSTINNVLSGMLDKCHPVGSLFYLFDKSQKLRALACIDQVGLLSKAHVRADQLSGGQQQRVGIARAIARSPLIVLADEPVASLDPLIAFQVLSMLKRISAAQGITVLCNLHQVDLALKFADRIIGLTNGKIVFDAPSESLDLQYLHNIYGSERQDVFFGAHNNEYISSIDVPFVS